MTPTRLLLTCLALGTSLLPAQALAREQAPGAGAGAPAQVFALSESGGQASLEQALPGQLDLLEQAMGGRMGIALFRTDDPTVQSFIASGILRVPKEAYLRLESGLAAVAVLAGKHNGKTRPMCYVLFNPQRAGSSTRAFFDPIAKATGQPALGAAYLAAHEVAHCLDHLQREALLAGGGEWDARQAEAAGIAPDAFARTFGEQGGTAAYRARMNDLYGDLAQRQFEERVADAFGVMWAWKMGAGVEVLEAVSQVRARDNAHNAHATAPILARLPAMHAAVGQAQDLPQLWALARQAQRAVGVDPSLGPGSQVAQDPMAQVVRQARAAAKSPATPQAPPPARRARTWDELPRFGER